MGRIKEEASLDKKIESIIYAHSDRLAEEIANVYDMDIEVTPKISAHRDEKSGRMTLNIVFSAELDAPTPETPSFVERRFYTVPLDHFAVTDGEIWKTYPKNLCRGARIITCAKCGRPAVIVDAMFPYFRDLNRCQEHTADVDPRRKTTEAR